MGAVRLPRRGHPPVARAPPSSPRSGRRLSWGSASWCPRPAVRPRRSGSCCADPPPHTAGWSRAPARAPAPWRRQSSVVRDPTRRHRGSASSWPVSRASPARSCGAPARTTERHLSRLGVSVCTHAKATLSNGRAATTAVSGVRIRLLPKAVLPPWNAHSSTPEQRGRVLLTGGHSRRVVLKGGA